MGKYYNLMKQHLNIRGYSTLTVNAYLDHMKNFIAFHMKSPDHITLDDITTYQAFLVYSKKVSSSTLNIAVCAIKYFYKHIIQTDWNFECISFQKRPKSLPSVLSKEEITHIINAAPNLKYKAVIQTLYSAGLRLAELVNLHLTDIDSKRMLIRIRQGKGKKDRYVMLSNTLLTTLRQYWKQADPKPRSYLFPGTPNPHTHFSRRSVQRLVKETTLLAHPDNLGVNCGFFAILHTWDQRLNLHPHVHCVVPGGGLTDDKTSWVSSSEKFLVPVRKLSLVFRGKFLSGMDLLYRTNQLTITGDISTLKHNRAFKSLLKTSCSTDWVVYAKPPFNGPYWVLRYLARYTHRIALSNSRIIANTDDDKVLISWRDRKHGNVKKIAAFDPVVFMQKFLLHVLPFRFVRIRYYGFMGNTIRRERIALIRVLLNDSGNNSNTDGTNTDSQPVPSGWVGLLRFLTGVDPLVCKACGKGRMVLVEFTEAYRIRDG